MDITAVPGFAARNDAPLKEPGVKVEDTAFTTFGLETDTGALRVVALDLKVTEIRVPM